MLQGWAPLRTAGRLLEIPAASRWRCAGLGFPTSLETRATLRRRMRELRSGLKPALVAEWSILIGDRVLTLPVVERAGLVHVFVGALAGEVETRRVIEGLLGQGKQVACPRIVAGQADLTNYEVWRLDDLVRSEMGLWEPDPGRCREVAVDELDVVLGAGTGL